MVKCDSQKGEKEERKIKSWKKMKEKVKAKFLPDYYLQDDFLKLSNMKQGDKSVEGYTREFEQLLLKAFYSNVT